MLFIPQIYGKILIGYNSNSFLAKTGDLTAMQVSATERTSYREHKTNDYVWLLIIYHVGDQKSILMTIK